MLDDLHLGHEGRAFAAGGEERPDRTRLIGREAITQSEARHQEAIVGLVGTHGAGVLGSHGIQTTFVRIRFPGHPRSSSSSPASRSRRARRPRWMRDFTVPSDTPVMSAISW